MSHTDPFQEPESQEPEFTTADLEKLFAAPLDDDVQSVADAKAQAEFAAEAKAKEKSVKPKKGGAKKHTAPSPPDGMTADKARAASTAMRQGIVKLLQAVNPAAYKEYKAIKFKGCAKGERPSLEQAKAAYLYAFGCFLEATYTESGN